MTSARTERRSDDARTGWLFALPGLMGLLIFVFLPFVLAIILSFTNLRLGSPLPLEFMGVTQYQRIFTDLAFLSALRNNSLFALIVVPLQTAVALLLALLIDRPLRGMVVFRTLFFARGISLVSGRRGVDPHFCAGAQGILNNVLETVTLGGWQARDFLRDPAWALPAITLTSIWQGVGFQMVILLAALQGIPDELYEAAQIDGANHWQQFVFITVPQLRNAIIFVVLVTTILAFRLFDQVQIMTQGGPDHATTTVMYEAVNAAFGSQQVARAAAMTVVFFIIVLLITLLQRYLARQERVVE